MNKVSSIIALTLLVGWWEGLLGLYKSHTSNLQRTFFLGRTSRDLA